MPPLTYASYLKLDSLLDLQDSRSAPPEHDEMRFIVIHQVYELWFKEMLHEVEIAAELQHRVLTDRMVGGDEGAEVQT